MGNVHDIAPDLYSAVAQSVRYEIERDKDLQELIAKAKENKLLQKEAYRAAELRGRIASESLMRYCDKAILPDGKMYYNIANRVVGPILRESYDDAARLSVAAQKVENEARGLGIQAVEPELNEDRIDGIINRISYEDDFDNAKWLLGDPVETFTIQAVTDTIRANAEAQWEAGLRTVIVRVAQASCCKWCSGLAGTYDYEQHRATGDDIWRRHAHCKCQVLFDNHSGAIQDSHSKKFFDPQELISRYEAAGNFRTAQKIKGEVLEKAWRNRKIDSQEARKQTRFVRISLSNEEREFLKRNRIFVQDEMTDEEADKLEAKVRMLGAIFDAQKGGTSNVEEIREILNKIYAQRVIPA